MPREATKAEKHTLIEQGTEFKGTMKSSCPVVVNGRIEGDLSAPELDVTATGTVQGNIKAERLSSRGVLSGNIDAGDLFLSGSIGSSRSTASAWAAKASFSSIRSMSSSRRSSRCGRDRGPCR